MRKLNLDILNEGQKGLSQRAGGFYLEALVYCLMINNHSSGTILKVDGEFEEEFELIWSDKLTEQIKTSWSDSIEAVEYGATGLAVLLVKYLLDFEILQRNFQTSRTDYKIGKPKNSEVKAVLEVSGILSESPSNTINARVNRKNRQVKNRSDNLPAYIIVTEFSSPKSKIIRNE